jgi:hypothetical protein
VWVYGWIGFRTLSGLIDQIWDGIPHEKVKWQHTIHGHDRYQYFHNIRTKYCYANLPRFIDFHKPWFKPVPLKDKTKQVGFYPSFSLRQKPYMRFDGSEGMSFHKNWKQVKNAVGDLPVVSNSDNLPYKDVIRLKAKDLFYMDDITTPILSNAAFEALACGTPCITAYDEYTEDQVKEVLRCDTLPFITTKPQNIRETVEEVLALPNEEISYLNLKSRQWIETYYSPKRVAEMYIKFYER